MVDYRINLAKTLTSSPEERTRFYNGMLIYLVLCAGGLVFVAYTSTLNLLDHSNNRRARTQLLATTSAEVGVDKNAFKNTDQAFTELKSYSGQIHELRQMLSQQKELLPVVQNLFINLPTGVVLKSLMVNEGKIAFGLTMPPASVKTGDPVLKLKTEWESNPELMKRVSAIRPLIGERRTVGEKSIFYVKFECILKK